MKYCSKCGTEMNDNAAFCEKCGCPSAEINQTATTPSPAVQEPEQDAPSGGYAALGFFFPLVGLILFCVWIGSFPMRAKSAGKGALWGFICSLIVAVLIWYGVYSCVNSSSWIKNII